MQQLILKRTYEFDELQARLQKLVYRGVYDKNGNPLRPYANATFSLATVEPPKTITEPPMLVSHGVRQPLFTPQPTIYENQIQIMETIDAFLATQNMKLNQLEQMVEYSWEGRGDFHVLPPIVEQHSYSLQKGFVDLAELSSRLHGCYVKDANGNLHNLGDRFLKNFHIDEISKVDHMDIFHSNASLLNYGLPCNGIWQYNVICDGSHRIDYAIEKKREPVTVILAEPTDGSFLPYYAFPMPFRPTLRLSSKRAERMYPRLERDKFHILNDFINKIFHYDWSAAELDVSSLRSKKEIY